MRITDFPNHYLCFDNENLGVLLASDSSTLKWNFVDGVKSLGELKDVEFDGFRFSDELTGVLVACGLPHTVSLARISVELLRREIIARKPFVSSCG